MTDWSGRKSPDVRAVVPAPSSERVSDADRDQVVTLLRDHVAVGRLTLDEFSERMGIAL
jgi:hypothetical protein